MVSSVNLGGQCKSYYFFFFGHVILKYQLECHIRSKSPRRSLENHNIMQIYAIMITQIPNCMNGARTLKIH